MIKRLGNWFKSRRALLDELNEERQIAHYFSAIVKKDFDNVPLVDQSLGEDGLRMAFKSPGFAGLLAAFMAQSLKSCGAKAYVEMRAIHPDYGSMIFSVRREAGETPAEKAHRMEERVTELERSFDLRWKADQRAIKRWQAAHPGNDLIWPDHADLCVWLMEQLEQRQAALIEIAEHDPKSPAAAIVRHVNGG